MNSRKTVGALGGTFDHFHKGHKHFLDFAAKQADQLLIGVTNQSLVREKELSAIIQPYEVRTEAVRKYCEAQHINFEIVELTDPFGPTLGQQEVDCLIVTELTQHGGEILNKRRAGLQLPSLPVYVCSMLHDESGHILNSTRIRQGLVNREGQVYSKLFESDLVLTDSQKEFFKTPIGSLVNRPPFYNTFNVVVGDICLENFRLNNWSYTLGVYDQRSQRQLFESKFIQEITPDEIAQNLAGTLSKEVVEKVLSLLKAIHLIGSSHPKHLQIRGEEDLITAVMILLLPLYSHVFYGQPGEGMVEVVVTEEIKMKLWEVLKL